MLFYFFNLCVVGVELPEYSDRMYEQTEPVLDHNGRFSAHKVGRATLYFHTPIYV